MERRYGMCALAVVGLLSVTTGCSSMAPVPSSTGAPQQACAEPHATASPSTAIPGEAILLEGDDWEACNDTSNDGAPEPWGGLSLEWVQTDATIDLGDVTPVDGSFQHPVTVPSDATSGPAVIRITAPEFTLDLPVSVVGG